VNELGLRGGTFKEVLQTGEGGRLFLGLYGKTGNGMVGSINRLHQLMAEKAERDLVYEGTDGLV